jgi:hypothetical protein
LAYGKWRMALWKAFRIEIIGSPRRGHFNKQETGNRLQEAGYRIQEAGHRVN